MYRADYHTHSRYSFDGSEELETMCQAAVAAGLDEIAITDHMDIFTGLEYGHMINFDEPGGRDYYMDVEGLYRNLAQIREKYRGRLKVVIGTELGQPQVNPEQARLFLAKYRPDFVIGSIHNMENDLDVYYYDFTQIDVPSMYDHYLDWLLELARTGDFDVMGHLTYPLRYYYEREHRTLDLHPYEEKFRDLFRILIQNGRGIELNVSGLYKPMKDTMPTFEVLRLYRACGGEIITIGSDAHKAQYIGAFQKEGQAMLREAGFRDITVFEARKPEFIRME
ncbi:MAG: histidinol-phosphatase HisJ family protein [Lachnospiraceae bacterium]|jgi:histidinol-phosphatase (PHP family)